MNNNVTKTHTIRAKTPELLEKKVARWLMKNRPAEGWKGLKTRAKFLNPEVKTMVITWEEKESV